MSIAKITFWASDFGDIILPTDMPVDCIRKDGWFDRRYRLAADMQDYIEEQSQKLADDVEMPGFQAPSFVEWRAMKRAANPS